MLQDKKDLNLLQELTIVILSFLFLFTIFVKKLINIIFFHIFDKFRILLKGFKLTLMKLNNIVMKEILF